MNILVLGASGMLGSQLFLEISGDSALKIFGTIRDVEIKNFFPRELGNQLILIGDIFSEGELSRIFKIATPDVVINCISLKRSHHNSFKELIKTYSLLPHRLARICRLNHSRLILISSDGVFSGNNGNYNESSMPDAEDDYGISKILGEVGGENIITIRTSIIGHELRSKVGLLEWFLAQEGTCRGYTKAIFSGLPTITLARVINKYLICDDCNLNGIYNISSEPISKFDLLSLISEKYHTKIDIIPDSSQAIDRSLNSKHFHADTGCEIPSWPVLIDDMYNGYLKYKSLMAL